MGKSPWNILLISQGRQDSHLKEKAASRSRLMGLGLQEKFKLGKLGMENAWYKYFQMTGK